MQGKALITVLLLRPILSTIFKNTSQARNSWMTRDTYFAHIGSQVWVPTPSSLTSTSVGGPASLWAPAGLQHPRVQAILHLWAPSTTWKDAKGKNKNIHRDVQRVIHFSPFLPVAWPVQSHLSCSLDLLPYDHLGIWTVVICLSHQSDLVALNTGAKEEKNI